MSQFTELLPATKSEKCGALRWVPNDDPTGYIPAAGVVTISGKRSFCSYKVEEFPADFGRGFMLFKLCEGSDRTEERYACQVGTHARNCDCKGFTFAGHCKHLAALVTLISAGQL